LPSPAGNFVLTESPRLCSIPRMPVHDPKGAQTHILPILIALPLALVTAASYLGTWWWELALIGHFRPHLAALSLVSSGMGILWRARLGATLSLGLLAVNTAPLLPYLGIAAGGGAVPPANLRVLTYNMRNFTTDRALFREQIQREQADVVVLSELTDSITVLAEETPGLPAYHSADPPHLLDSAVVFSRWPLTNQKLDRTADGLGSVLSTELCTSDRWRGCLRVVALHSAPPFGTAATTQAQQLEIAARFAAAAPERRVVLAGDLDLTPWSPAFAKLLARGELVDTGPQRGLTATWLSRVPFVGLMIDHVLVSPDIAVADNRLGSDLGSSHFPVIVDLAIPFAAPEPSYADTERF
jgi:endonuclease/exonuclease/phosphatase (EEP) superfamily protein YafD